MFIMIPYANKEFNLWVRQNTKNISNELCHSQDNYGGFILPSESR